MSVKKLWIISEIYYPVKTSTGYYVTEIAEYLAKKGIDVHVICTGATYNEGECSTLLKEETHKGVKIHRVIIANIDKNNFFKRCLRLFLSSFCIFFKILSSVKRGDDLLVVTNPAFLILMMPYVAWQKKIDYTILVHDIFPENLVAIKKLSSSSFAYKLLKRIFDKAYSKACLCISLGRDMNEILASKIHTDTAILQIPIWSENEDVYPLDKNETALCNELSLKEKFIFQFAGNLGHAQGIDNLLDAVRMIDNRNIHFLFIGGGARSSEIASFIRNNENGNVSLIGFQDRSRQNDFLNSCDVGIVTLSDGMYGLGVPSKSYNIMAAGKPILYVGDARSEIALCIDEFHLGWVVEPNNPCALKNMIELIYSNRNNLSSIRDNARTVAEGPFAKKNILERYFKLYAIC